MTRYNSCIRTIVLLNVGPLEWAIKTGSSGVTVRDTILHYFFLHFFPIPFLHTFCFHHSNFKHSTREGTMPFAENTSDLPSCLKNLAPVVPTGQAVYLLLSCGGQCTDLKYKWIDTSRSVACKELKIGDSCMSFLREFEAHLPMPFRM